MGDINLENELINNMKIYRPLLDNPNDLPDNKGLYIITIDDIEALPDDMKKLNYSFIENRAIIYVGISNKGIRSRDYRCHFKGTARISTLRKSLGALMNLEKEIESIKKSRYKFKKSEERYLSEWMNKHLWLHYILYENVEELEKELIISLNPPLNIKCNSNEINEVFRKELKRKRNHFSDSEV